MRTFFRSGRTDRRLQFESLEARAMLAGNVTASVVNGVLQITGDSDANSIQIQQSGTQIKVTGLSTTSSSVTAVQTATATTVNGSTSALSFRGVTAINLDMLAGNDSVKLTNVAAQTVSGSMGTGDDTVSLSGGTINFGLTFDLGTGKDSFTATNVLVQNKKAKTGNVGQVAIDGGDGDDTISLSNVQSAYDVVLLGGLGKNSITVSQTAITAGLDITTDAGNDTVNISSVTCTNLAIDVGDGANSVTLTTMKISGFAEIDSGDGKDAIKASGLTVSGTLGVATGDSADTVSIATTKAHEIDVALGDGDFNQLVLTSDNSSIAHFSTTSLVGNLMKTTASKFATKTVSGFQIIS